MSSKASKEESKQNLPAETNAAPEDYLRSYGMGALDNLGQEDQIMPRYKLIQNTSKTGTPGKWASNLNPDNELDSLSIVILDISNFKTLFPEPGQGDRPLCRSNDGKVKVGDGIGDEECQSCRYNVWVKDTKTGKSIPPKCKSGYTLLALILLPDGNTEVGMVSFKGSAIRPIKQFFTRMKAKRMAPFCYKTLITSVQESNDKGRYYKPAFNFGPYLTEEEVKYAAGQSKNYSNYITSAAMVDIENDEVPDESKFSGATEFLNTLATEKACAQAESAPTQEGFDF